MLNFLRYSEQSPQHDSLIHLYESAFPFDERRPTDQFLALAATEARFAVNLLFDDDVFVGFVSVWHFGDFNYIEHFAVLPEMRGKNYGSEVLDKLLQQASPIVLEVEPPQDDLAQRRIAFYERHSFRCNERPYLQPPYSPERKALELLLMSNDKAWLNANFDSVVRLIHKAVYRCEA